MPGDWNDDEIKRRFAEWRAADTGKAPPFDATYRAAGARATRRAVTAPWRRVAQAAVILVVAGAGWLSLHRHVPPSSSQVATAGTPPLALSEWRSPTAFLLQGPSDALVKTVPTFSADSVELNALGVHAGRRRPS